MVLEFCLRMARVAVTDHFGKQADLRLSSMFFSRTLNIRNDARPRSPGTLISQLRDLDQMRELLTSSTLGVLIDLPFVAVFLPQVTHGKIRLGLKRRHPLARIVGGAVVHDQPFKIAAGLRL